MPIKFRCIKSRVSVYRYRFAAMPIKVPGTGYIENFDLMHLPGTSRQRLGAPRNAISQCTEAQSRCTWQVHQVGLRYDIAQVPERHPKAPKSSSAWRCPWSLPLASYPGSILGPRDHEAKPLSQDRTRARPKRGVAEAGCECSGARRGAAGRGRSGARPQRGAAATERRCWARPQRGAALAGRRCSLARLQRSASVAELGCS
jgi:hypothetical protein